MPKTDRFLMYSVKGPNGVTLERYDAKHEDANGVYDPEQGRVVIKCATHGVFTQREVQKDWDKNPGEWCAGCAELAANPPEVTETEAPKARRGRAPKATSEAVTESEPEPETASEPVEDSEVEELDVPEPETVGAES